MEHSAHKNGLAKIREILWPIYGIEHKKFIPMTLMISLILFNYTVIRNTKDVLVTTATEGSEIITFLKFWVVLPLSVIFFLVYSKLSNTFSRQTLFYGFVSFFLIFFALFALVFYPHQDIIHPIQSADKAIKLLPVGFKHFINIYKYWSFSLFYAFAELWGVLIGTLMFWQFANSIVKVSEAKRFYAHFYLLANLATAFSGVVSKYFAKKGKEIADPVLAYTITIEYLMGTVFICGIVVLLLYFYMNKYILHD